MGAWRRRSGNPSCCAARSPVYGDVNRLTVPLGIEDRSTIALFLVDGSHAVRWAGSGAFSPDTAADLERALREV